MHTEASRITIRRLSPWIRHAEQLSFLCEARAATAVVEASAELGILERLDRSPVDAAALAEECGVSQRAAESLLAALESLGLADRHPNGSYGAAGCDVNGFMRLLESWDRLADKIRQPETQRGDTLEGAQDIYPGIVTSLAAMFAPAAAAAAQNLASAGPRVLDLGAGAAPWSLALAAHDPSCRVTAVDLPVVLGATRQAVAAAGYEDRFRFVEGDVFAVNLGEAAFDLVIAANLCHLFGEEANRRLFDMTAQWLVPGGVVAVIEPLSQEGLNGSRALSLYAVGLAHRTASGKVYPFRTYTEWLHAAGFRDVKRIELAASPPATLVCAQLPCQTDAASCPTTHRGAVSTVGSPS
jgi:ubiquinone/menaquinone biosynthesis C-methylase UbiE